MGIQSKIIFAVGFLFLGLAPSVQASLVRKNASGQPQIISLRILARVADKSISSRDMVLEWLLQNPRSYVRGQRTYFSKSTENALLNEKIIQVLVDEEARIIGTQQVSANEIDKELLRVKGIFAARWNQFLSDFEISELEIKNLLSKQLLVERTLNVRMQDALRISDDSDEAFERAEESLHAWLQQLRSRYKVHMYLQSES